MVQQNLKCSSTAELEACLACNVVDTPSVEESLINIQSPISQNEINFLSGATDASGAILGMDLFQSEVPPATPDPLNPAFRSLSHSFAKVGARMRCDFALDAVCFIFRVEPNSYALDGNQFFGMYTQAGALVRAGAFIPPSPRHANWRVFDGEGQPHDDWCNAQFEVGGPQWRAAYWAMQAFRMSMNCPSACNARELLNERLVDIGNCDLGTQQQGFSCTETPWIHEVRAANRRLLALRAAGQVPIIADGDTPNVLGNNVTSATMDIGVFMPFNCDQQFVLGTDLALHRVQSADRSTVVKTAYGNMRTSPGAYKWYRPLRPRIIKKDENIEIYLKHDLQDRDFFGRMIGELSIDMCRAPIPGIACDHGDIPVGDGASYTSLTHGCFLKLPFGTLSLGIILKGWKIDRGLCDTIYDKWNALSDSDFAATRLGQARLDSAGLTEAGYAGPTMDTVLETGVGCGCSR